MTPAKIHMPQTLTTLKIIRPRRAKDKTIKSGMKIFHFPETGRTEARHRRPSKGNWVLLGAVLEGPSRETESAIVAVLR